LTRGPSPAPLPGGERDRVRGMPLAIAIRLNAFVFVENSLIIERKIVKT